MFERLKTRLKKLFRGPNAKKPLGYEKWSDPRTPRTIAANIPEVPEVPEVVEDAPVPVEKVKAKRKYGTRKKKVKKGTAKKAD